MTLVPTCGLTRRELEYHLRWSLRRLPDDPARVPEYLGEVMVTLIERNNAAVAAYLAESDRADLPEGF